MKKLYLRFIARTPRFWKKVQRLGLALSACAVAIFANAGNLPALVVAIAPYVLTASIAIAFISQLTIEDSGGDKNV